MFKKEDIMEYLRNEYDKEYTLSFNGEVWVASIVGESTYLRSIDGCEWEEYNYINNIIDFSLQNRSITVYDNTFVLLAYTHAEDDMYMLSSTDGINWLVEYNHGFYSDLIPIGARVIGICYHKNVEYIVRDPRGNWERIKCDFPEGAVFTGYKVSGNEVTLIGSVMGEVKKHTFEATGVNGYHWNMVYIN